MKTNIPEKRALIKQRNDEAVEVLKLLGFGPRQCNEMAAYVLLALLDINAEKVWNKAENPMRGITPIIEFIHQNFGIKYAPNTRETVRDEAVKYFAEAGILMRNPDNPTRPTNSGKTVYQVEVNALELFRSYGSKTWERKLKKYLANREKIRSELNRKRKLTRIPVKLPNKKIVTLSPGGQNPLIKRIIEEFCSRFAPGAFIVYIGDAENKFLHMDADYLKRLRVVIEPSAKMPDVVVHDKKRNWLLLIEAVTSVGPIDGKRRRELKYLFKGCTAGLVFVTAFENRQSFRRFQNIISWETEVWIAEDPDHIVHFDGERFLGPYPDVMPDCKEEA